MEQSDRKQILHNIKLLTQPNIIDYSKLDPYLLQKKIFTKQMIEDIDVEKTNTDRVNKLLVDLCTRGPHAFQSFIDILRETRQVEALKILLPDLETNSVEMQSNEVDGSCQGKSKVDAEATQLSTVKMATEWIEGDECYKMTSRPRGLCLIINNDDFQGIKSKRKGSKHDFKMAKKVFEDLGYAVQAEKNLSAFDMETIIAEFAERDDHLSLDSCVVVIMSHGDKGIVYGSDSEPIVCDAIYHLFNNQRCHNLIGKPKLFFIQSCRGCQFDVGVSVSNIPKHRPVKNDGPTMFSQHTKDVNVLPTWTDILISYSSVEGYVSNRHEIFGTWYIQTLLDVLMRKAWNTDLYSILQEVGAGVANIENYYGEKQSPELVQRGFSKKLYFNPGLYK